jgi:hypothetical protein
VASTLQEGPVPHVDVSKKKKAQLDKSGKSVLLNMVPDYINSGGLIKPISPTKAQALKNIIVVKPGKSSKYLEAGDPKNKYTV